MAQIIPKLPNAHSYSDACKYGAGGVWIIPEPNGTIQYIFWSIDFPPEVIRLFESINDLEMAGVLLVWLVLECHMPSLHRLQAGIECDNSSSVHWTRKYSAKSYEQDIYYAH